MPCASASAMHRCLTSQKESSGVPMRKNQSIEVVLGDITRENVDAIVNAANKTLLGGGGVDGAIHRAAGPELLEECRALGGCQTGQAKITAGYNLPARFVIHTVGPVWSGGRADEENLLASCYRESLRLALGERVESIAFPAISCGAYRFPVDRASRIAVREVERFLSEHRFPLVVKLVCFDMSTYDAFQAALAELES